MLRGFALVFAVLLSASSLVVASPVAAAPSCHGKVATIVMTAPGTVSINVPNSVVIGTDGNDSFGVFATNVLICAGAGDDYAFEPNGTAVIYLGAGNDTANASHGSIVYGEAGADSGHAYGGTFYGGSGDDGMYVENSATGYGGTGNDYLAISSGGTGYGETGNDSLVVSYSGIGDGGSGNDDMLVSDAISLRGGSGRDTITVLSGDPVIDCGSGKDTLVLQVPVTSYRRCEVV